ncbi:nuclear transport factor 2 family protein [Aromatoleum diolicum]|uniref:Nuclear transport factor 2 family protein n=1 Tax=Aromatoleum diolicum TaxID=75796 RepID=A0ABX1QC42_9RHOO|nr:nuclear transport factor 2 family protein [Aromatoleum diolicum]NMG75966.1 nuclear transport factor 2 family protein [Aromatoleum diolicum]
MHDAVTALAHFYETLTPQSLARLGDFYATDACFKDPFNEVQGIAAIECIFRHMFAHLDDPCFEVTARIADGRQAMLGWVFRFRRRDRRIEIRGVSHIQFDNSARVIVHRDYWDAAEELYAKLPGLGVVMRALRRRLSATE